MSSDMMLVNQIFQSVKDELKAQRTSIRTLQNQTENVPSAFAPRIYDTLADADAAMVIDGVFYSGYAFAIIKDVRDIGEGAGNGTGALCIWKPTPTNDWMRLDNTSAVI